MTDGKNNLRNFIQGAHPMRVRIDPGSTGEVNLDLRPRVKLTGECGWEGRVSFYVEVGGVLYPVTAAVTATIPKSKEWED